jgi:hypothetical protein
MCTVEEAIVGVLAAPNGSVLVAKEPFGWESEARYVEFAPDFSVPETVKSEGFRYLLEKDGILEVLSWARGRRMSARTKAELVIHYAVMDALPAWFDDIPRG